MRRDARGAVIRVTPLRLDAADRHHRFTAHVDGVAAQCKRENGGFGKAQFARSDEDDPLMQTVFRQDLLNSAETHFEWQRDVIGEDERPGTGAAFAAINGDEVDAARTPCHQARQVLPERRIAHGGLDPDWKACFARDRLDEIEHLVGVPECAVRGRADAIAVHRNAADLGDFSE